MKARILGQINKNDNNPFFSTQDYSKLQTAQEKSEYLNKYLQYFLVRLDLQNTQRQKNINSLLQSFKDFSEILSLNYSILLPDNFEALLQILPIEKSILETIPNSANFLQLIDLIMYQCFQRSDTNIQKLSSSAIIALFSSKVFCKVFIDSGKYIDTITTLVDYSDTQLMHSFFDFFLNENFIQCIIEIDVHNFTENLPKQGSQINLSCSKFVFSLFSKLFFSDTTIKNNRYQLLEFGSKIIVTIFNSLNMNQPEKSELSNLFIQDLSNLDLFSKANEFFISFPSINFMSMFYGNLLLNLSNNNNEFNSIIIKYLHDLYNDDNFSVEEGRVVVMHFFQTLNINYFSNENNFHILDWINDSVFKSSLLFQVTSSFLSKCVYYDTSLLATFIDFFIQKVSPPYQKGFLYNDVFSWFLSLISILYDNDNKTMNGEQNKIDENHYFFDIRKFLSKIFYEPTIQDVSYFLIHFDNFQQLLLHISIMWKDSDKRNSIPKKIFSNGKIVENENNKKMIIQIDDSLFDEIFFSRIIELIEYNRNEESLQDFLLNFLKNSFGKNLVLYFFQNICSSNVVQILLFSFTQEFTEQLIQIIVSFKLLDEIMININEDNSIPIFKIINSIAIKTNNHFFDDYIINNISKNSSILKLDFKKIEKFILPSFYDDPIPIPSLIPLLIIDEKMNFKSPYNHFLLGKYSLPIYNKLNISVSKIPCLQEIVNQFIRFKDFCYIFQNGPKEASMVIQTGKQPEFPFNIYEIFPSDKPSSILLNITASFAAFKIRFETKYKLTNVLFNINGSPILFVKDNHLIDISNASIGTIQLNKWYTISFYYNKNMKNISIGLDSEIISTLSISSKDFQIDSIGSLQNPTSIHYIIMNSISIGNNNSELLNFSEELASKYFKPQGNVLFVSNHSFHRLFESRHAFSRFCEMIETSKITKSEVVPIVDSKNRRRSIVSRQSKKVISESERKYHDKAALFVSLMSSWILSNNISSEWYLNRYRYCMMINYEYCEPFYLTSILQTIINLKDKMTRTKLFYNFIYDYFFWTKFPERVVGQVLDLINNFIDDFQSSFDLKILEETNIGDFLLSLTYFFRNSFVLNGLIKFLTTLFVSFDEKYVAPLLSNFAIISSCLNANEIEIVFDLEKEHNMNFSNTIVTFAIEISRTRKMKLFKVEELFVFALLMSNQQLAINFTMKILQLCDSDQFVQQYLSILCRIVSRFPFNNLIWQRLFQLLMNDKSFVLSFGPNSNLNQYNFSNGIRTTILPLIMSALIPLFNEDSMFSDNIKKIVFHILRENQLNLISKSTIKIFSAFLNGSIFGIVKENSVSQTVFPNQKVKDFYLTFIDDVNRIFFTSRKPNSSFIQFSSMLLCSFLVNQATNFKRFSLLLSVAVHSSGHFLIQMLITFFSSYIQFELSNQQMTLLNDISLFALLNEKDINVRNDLSNSIFVYCVQNHERFVLFAKFFVFSYKYVSNDVKFRTLRAFQEYFNIQPPKTLNEIIPFLFIILCTDLKEAAPDSTKENKEKKVIQKVDNSPKSIIIKARNQRLMNKRVKEQTNNNDTNDNESTSSTYSFAFNLFNYFLSTFKQFPKDNKLSLLLKYKDFKDLISHQKSDVNDLQQVKNYILMTMKNLQEEAYNSYKITDLKGAAIPQDNLGIFLFTHFSDVAQRGKNFFNNLLSDMNYFLRRIEKYYGSFLYINSTITSQNFTFQKLNEITKSYHISPFYYPGFCPVVLSPSPFSALNNDDIEISKDIWSTKIEMNLFGLEKQNNFCHSKFPEFSQFDGYFDYSNKSHKLKISFNHYTDSKTHKLTVYYIQLNSESQQQQNILSFISIYGRPLQIFNCNLIRKFINIPAVLFKYKERYLVLSNCNFDGKDVTFQELNETENDSKIESNSYISFLQSVFLNEFGQYFLFCGHPVLLLRLNDFVISHQCTDDTVTWSVGVFTCLNGSFVLSFSREDIASLQQNNSSLQQIQDEPVSDPPSIHKLNSIEELKQGTVENWLNGKVSNIHYITLLNLISGRSFDDLSSYPIVPRVLSSFSGRSFKEDYHHHLRNLRFPVSVLSEALKSKSHFELEVSDSNSIDIDDENGFDAIDEVRISSPNVDLTDPCFDTLKMRYEMQKYHNCENISNGSVVSSFLIRIPPFLNYSLQFNDGGFDTADRLFSSISMFCGINKFSTSELIPELFLVPEMLTNNFNKIKLPNGVPENVVLPQWSSLTTSKSKNKIDNENNVKSIANNDTSNNSINNDANFNSINNDTSNNSINNDTNLNSINNDTNLNRINNDTSNNSINNDTNFNSINNDTSIESKIDNEANIKSKIDKGIDINDDASIENKIDNETAKIKDDSNESVKMKAAGETISSYNFIQMHRSVLESVNVRGEISKWIDLVFGFKQSGEEAVNSLNLYNPLSYQSSVGTLPQLAKSASASICQSQFRTMRAEFVKNSGQMPLKIFTSPHQPYLTSSSSSMKNESTTLTGISSSLSNFSLKSSPTKKSIQKVLDKKTLFGFSFDDISIHFSQIDNIDRSCLNRVKGTIQINMAKNTFKLFNPEFFNAKNICISKRGDFFAVTFCTSKVKIFHLFYSTSDCQQQQQQNININGQQQILQDTENNVSFTEISVLSRESISFSVINERQYVCASVCKEEVVLWSMINGFITQIIPLKDVRCLTFDEELNLIYIGVGSEVHQFSINGLLLRTIKTGQEDKNINKKNSFDDKNELVVLPNFVESLAVGGFGFSYEKRFIAVGRRNGTVSIYRQNRETLDFELISLFEVSSYPIVKLIANQNNPVIDAIDSYNSLPTVF